MFIIFTLIYEFSIFNYTLLDFSQWRHDVMKGESKYLWAINNNCLLFIFELFET